MSAIDWNNPRLKVRGLRKNFDQRVVLGGVDLEIYPGQIVALIGSSGSGKSTLLRCINLIETISDGQIWLEGEDISVASINQDEVRREIEQRLQLWRQQMTLPGTHVHRLHVRGRRLWMADPEFLNRFPSQNQLVSDSPEVAVKDG